MFATVWKNFFGCSHKNTTFPITLRGAKAPHRQTEFDTYVVCLDCGKEFPYSWEEMHILPAETGRAMAGVAEQARSFSITK